MKRICVYCGSSPGSDPEYGRVAQALGRLLAERNIGLVYGGGSVGIMGQVAQAVLDAGGEVIGVIPKMMIPWEVALTRLANLHVVETMHERKAMMAELGDAFIALPGGFGTFEEIFEVLTWAQLDLHHKPCGLLNVAHYYDRLVEFVDVAVTQQFIQPAGRSLLLVDETPEGLLQQFETYQPPKFSKAEWALQQTKRG